MVQGTKENKGTKGSGVFDIDRDGGIMVVSATCHDDCEFASGGYAYHVLNRAVGRMRIFGKERDFEAFEEVIARGQEARADAGVGVVRACPTIGTSCFGRAATATCRSSCVG